MTVTGLSSNSERGTEMGTGDKKANNAATAGEPPTTPPGRTERYVRGCRLMLEYVDDPKPELHKALFRYDATCRAATQERKTDPRFSWQPVTQALSLFLLGYVCDSFRKPHRRFVFRGPKTGSPAGTLSNAFYNSTSFIHDLFLKRLATGGEIPCLRDIIRGNYAVRSEPERALFIDEELLPPDCIQVNRNGKELKLLSEIKALRDDICKSLGLPPEPEEESLTSDVPKPQAGQPEKKPDELSEKEQFRLGKWFAGQFEEGMKLVRESLGTRPSEAQSSSQPKGRRRKKPAPDQSAGPQAKKEETQSEAASHLDYIQNALRLESKEPSEQTKESNKQAEPLRFRPAPNEIAPSLLAIQNPQGHEWEESEPLINFGEPESEEDVWRIRDASEGLLIMGSVGSGKTSSTGSLVATQYLTAGYGGLVLTAKPDEARRWLRLCERAGRMEDCVHLTPRSHHALNILQYEIQRPSDRVALTADLIALFRCLIDVMSRRSRSEKKEEAFWAHSTNDLMSNLFQIFLLAREPLTIDRLVYFVSHAPDRPKVEWSTMQYVAEIIERARVHAEQGTGEDQEAFATAFNYWTVEFPKIPDMTQGGIVTNFKSMAGSLLSPGIHEKLCGETNLTPEMILSGKIVILDFPLKESEQGGNMMQAAWKLLFQHAIERRADKGRRSARPVFLWEDEGHLFFSQYDVDFQPTARDCRASHVVISQNFHNFLHRGHDAHGVSAVFAAMNTYIFHTNGDYETNSWASERIGKLKRKRLTSSGIVRGFSDEDFTFFPRQPENIKSAGQFEIKEDEELAVPPEDFSKLKRGGDGTCEALVLWLSHPFACNRNRNFCVRTFAQEPR